MGDPFECLRGCVSPGADRDHVETAGPLGPARFGLQKEGSAVDQSLPLAGIYAFRGAAPGGVPTGAYLDEYYCIAVKHDQIELTTAPAPVAGDQAQSARLQELQGAVFALLTALEVRGLLHGVLSDGGTLVAGSGALLAGSGWATPLRNSAQGRWRTTR